MTVFRFIFVGTMDCSKINMDSKMGRFCRRNRVFILEVI